MQTYVFCSFRFVGMHYWPGAKDQYAYLTQVHRHEFHVEAGALVIGDDREIEFCEMKSNMKTWAEEFFGEKTTTFSCEQMAKQLIENFNLAWCIVKEDGENGALVLF